MGRAEKMCLGEKLPGERGGMFAPHRDGEMTAGDRFSMVEPKMSKESMAALIDVLWEILEEEGL
jgi:hypothetical protein